MTRFLAVLLFSSVFALGSGTETVWGPVDVKRWAETPCVSGRLSEEKDVKEGRAVFFIPGDAGTRATMKPIAVKIPFCAIYRDKKKNRDIPVIAIQAEEARKMNLVGYRPLTGGSGVCLLDDLEILPGPDQRFE
jgi:hypothetical protein